MKKSIVLAVLATAAFVAAMVFLEHGSLDPASDGLHATAAKANEATASTPATAGTPPGSTASDAAAGSAGSAASVSAPTDPRLIALAVSPDNGLIEFVRAPDGKVIAEIDKDPNSAGFGKPSREYLYSGDQVVAVTAYRYFPDHTEISQTRVSYKPDGSVGQFAESTRIDQHEAP